MKRNRLKEIYDIILVVLLLILVVASLIFSNNETIQIILVTFIFVVFISKIVLDVIFWRCPKCGSHLPAKLLYRDVVNCPYCGTNLYDNDI